MKGMDIKMKKLLLIHHFYSQIRISAAILFFVILIADFSIIFASGIFRYTTYTYRFVKDAELNHAIYVMTDVNLSQNADRITGDVEAVIDKVNSYEGVQKTVAVKTVNTFQNGDYYVSMLLYDDNMLELFPIRTDRKFSMEEFKNTSVDNISVIVGSKIFDNTDSGEKDTLTLISDNGRSFEIHVRPVAELKYPYIVTAFPAGGTTVTAENLLMFSQCLIAYESKEILEYFSRNADISISTNFIVEMDENISEEDSAELLSYINSIGSYVSYDEIVNNTFEETKAMIKKYLPLPIYFMFVSLVSLFSVALLTINKKMKDAVIYYICGYSRKNIFIHFLQSISVIYVLALLINTIFIYFFSRLNENQLIDVSTFIIDGNTVLYIILYSIILLLVTTAIPVVAMKKGTPIDVIRRTR